MIEERNRPEILRKHSEGKHNIIKVKCINCENGFCETLQPDGYNTYFKCIECDTKYIV